MPAATLTLELALPPTDGRELSRCLGRAGRPMEVSAIWHDTEAGDLVAAGQALAVWREGRATQWRLEALSGVGPAMAQGSEQADLPGSAARASIAVASLTGSTRRFRGSVTAILLEGSILAALGTLPVRRLTLHGAAPETAALALRLAERLGATICAESLSAMALMAAQHLKRPMAPMVLAPDLPLPEACARGCAGFTNAILNRGHQLADGTTGPAADPEPVHQMRVAVRRLRTALPVFARAFPALVADPPSLVTEAKTGLRQLGHVLGPARDWDVFLGGAARRIAQAFPDDPKPGRLANAARRRQSEAYDNLRAWLTNTQWRRLGVLLACLSQPAAWVSADTETAQPTLSAFATATLDRRWKRLRAPGGDLDALTEPELHAIRLHAKRLRYVAELFSPLFAGRDTARFLRRLSALQEDLGHLNDRAAMAALLGGLGGRHATAIGLLRGFAAAETPDLRQRIARSWKRMRQSDPFWR